MMALMWDMLGARRKIVFSKINGIGQQQTTLPSGA
jgi:hypothetical protein